MPELKKILETETARSNDRPDSLTIIDLYREGSFWRAYEWSAWLFVKFVRDFNVNKRKIKGGEGTYVFIGFPDTSLAGISESFPVIPLDEKHLRLNILGYPLESRTPIENMQFISELQSDISNLI